MNIDEQIEWLERCVAKFGKSEGAQEILSTLRALKESEGVFLIAADALLAEARRWQEHNGSPNGFAKECRDDAEQLRALAEMVRES